MSYTKFTNLFFLFSPLLIICLSIVVIIAAYVPLLGIVLTIGLFIGFWAFHDPVKPLILAICLIPFDRLTVIFPPQIAGLKGASFLSSITIPKLILLIVFFAWVSKTLVLKKRSIFKKLSENYLSVPVGIFVILCFASVVKVKGEGINLSVFCLIRLLSVVVLFFILVDLIDCKEHLRKLLQYLVISYLLVGLLGLYEVMAKQHILDLVGYPMVEEPFTISEGRFRAAGPAGDPDAWSFTTIFAFALTFFFLGPESSRKTKVILIPVLAIYFFNIVGSASKGGLIALLGTVVTFWLFLRLRHKWLFGISFFVGFGLLLFTYTIFVSDLPLARYTGEKGMTSVVYRIELAKMAWGMIKDAPLLGVGIGNFGLEFNRYVRLSPGLRKKPIAPHNSILQAWAECGFFALLAYLSLYIIAIVNLYKAIKKSRDPTVRQAAITALSILVGMIIYSLNYMVILHEAYWMNFAFAVIASNLSKTTTA